MLKSRLKFILLEKNMRMKTLSDLTGINRFYLSDLAHNKVKDLKIEYLTKICQVLNCELGDLFIREKKMMKAS